MRLALRKDLGPRQAAIEARLRELVAADPLDRVYAIKLAQALDYLQAGALSPLLADEAALRGLSAGELAWRIRERAQEADQRLVARERARQGLLARVRAARSETDLDAVEADLAAVLTVRS